jgi:hypothetical protein
VSNNKVVLSQFIANKRQTTSLSVILRDSGMSVSINEKLQIKINWGGGGVKTMEVNRVAKRD